MSMTREHLLVGLVVLSFAKILPFRRHLVWPERHHSRISHVESLDEQEARTFLPSCEGGISRPPFVLVPRHSAVVSFLSSTDYRMVLGSHSVSSGVSCFAFTPHNETSRVTSVASAPEAFPVLGVSHESLVLNIHVACQP